MIKTGVKTVYILIGPQGSGKTYWAKNVLMKHRKDIIRMSQDDQGRHGHRELFAQCVKEGKSIVVDRMNFSYIQRDRYVSQLYGKNYKVIFVWFKLAKDVCLERLKNRKGHPTITHDADHDDMLDFYFKEFQEPNPHEYCELLTIKGNKKASILDIRMACIGKRIIVVGDIHGCFTQFLALLKKCQYRSEDIVIATGDLVDRGPKIRQTLQWFRETPGTYTVMGNHDNKLMRYWNGNPVTINNGLECTIDQCSDFNPTEWCAWLSSLPHMIVLPKIHGLTENRQLYVVHAGIDGRIDINEQKVETCLYTRFLDGKDFLDAENGMPWWRTLDGSYSVASGHIINKNHLPHNCAYCLDGGAFEGGSLRALVIDGPGCHIEEISCNVI